MRSSGEKLSGGSEILQVDPYPLIIYPAAAIQDLNRKMERKETEIADLKQRLDRLKQLLNARNGGGL